MALSLETCLQGTHATIHAPDPVCKPASQTWLPNDTGSEGLVGSATGPPLTNPSVESGGAICVPKTGLVPWASRFRVDGPREVDWPKVNKYLECSITWKLLLLRMGTPFPTTISFIWDSISPLSLAKERCLRSLDSEQRIYFPDEFFFCPKLRDDPWTNCAPQKMRLHHWPHSKNVALCNLSTVSLHTRTGSYSVIFQVYRSDMFLDLSASLSKSQLNIST